jgi:hypothetical protein
MPGRRDGGGRVAGEEDRRVPGAPKATAPTSTSAKLALMAAAAAVAAVATRCPARSAIHVVAAAAEDSHERRTDRGASGQRGDRPASRLLTSKVRGQQRPGCAPAARPSAATAVAPTNLRVTVRLSTRSRSKAASQQLLTAPRDLFHRQVLLIGEQRPDVAERVLGHRYAGAVDHVPRLLQVPSCV